MHRFLLSASLLLCVIRCAAADATSFARDEVSVILHHFTSRNISAKSAVIVLRQDSSVGSMDPKRDWKARLRRSAEKSEVKIREAVEDFVAKNATSSSFDGLVVPPLRIVTLSEGAQREIFSDHSRDGWMTFRERYPNAALHTLSRVGFSKDRQLAIYYADSTTDWNAGEGQFHVVRKKGDRWVEDDSVEIGWRIFV